MLQKIYKEMSLKAANKIAKGRDKGIKVRAE